MIAGTAVIYFPLGSSGGAISPQSGGTSEQGQPKAADEPTGPVQPIPYSHKTHLALGLECVSCHANPAPAINVTYPSTKKCMACHENVAKDKPAIQKLAEYDKANQPMPWVRVYAVPAWVYWNHGLHLRAGMKCETCHGPVAEMTVMKLATNVTTMQGCVDCHEQRDAPAGCNTCHENTGTQ